MPISNLSNGLRTGVCTSTNRPTTPYEGQVIYETDTDKVFVWNGTAWVIPNAPAQNPTGLEFISSTAFSGSATAQFTSVFSSTYTDYRGLVRIKGSAVNAIYLRWLVNTTVQTDAIYTIEQRVQYTVGTLAIGLRAADQYAPMGAVSDSTRFSNYVIEFGSPQAAAVTNFAMTGNFQRSATDGDSYNINGGNRVTTQINGFEITSATAVTLEGTMTLYGYRNA